MGRPPTRILEQPRIEVLHDQSVPTWERLVPAKWPGKEVVMIEDELDLEEGEIDELGLEDGEIDELAEDYE